MSNNRTRLLVVVGAIAALAIFTLRDYLGLLLLGGAGLVIYLFPLIAVIALAVAAFNKLLPHTKQLTTSPFVKPATPTPSQYTSPLIQRLHTAFRRNQAADIDRVLSSLPSWPITYQLQATALVLLALKRSVYRAQVEGVPSSIIQRYLSNLEQASEILWQLASKVDALGQQNIAYELVAPRLEQEAAQLKQLQQSAQTAQDSIALLILSGIQSSGIQTIDEDLSALTVAIKQFMGATNKVAQTVTVKR